MKWKRGTRGGVNILVGRWRFWIKPGAHYRSGIDWKRGPYGSLSGSMGTPLFVATFIRRYPESRLLREGTT